MLRYLMTQDPMDQKSMPVTMMSNRGVDSVRMMQRSGTWTWSCCHCPLMNWTYPGCTSCAVWAWRVHWFWECTQACRRGLPGWIGEKTAWLPQWKHWEVVRMTDDEWWDVCDGINVSWHRQGLKVVFMKTKWTFWDFFDHTKIEALNLNPTEWLTAVCPSNISWCALVLSPMLHCFCPSAYLDMLSLEAVESWLSMR